MSVLPALAETIGTACAAVAVTVVVVVVLIRALQRLDRSDKSDDSDPGGDGGLRRGDPPRPLGGGSGGEPAWWPEFERGFAEYVTRERTR